jgi:hypothetical protein
MLLEDYRDEMRSDRSKHLKTISDLNTSIISKYKQFVDRTSVSNRQSTKLFKFKK